MSLNLSPALEPFRAKVQETATPFIRVKPQPARACKPWESKIGGAPYLPAGGQLPLGPDGDPLYFLGQINFAEIPALEPFPNKGLVQFFISDDDLYGMDIDEWEKQETFRVVFYPEVHQEEVSLQKVAPETRDYELLPHHPETEHPLQFELAEEYAPITDYRFFEHFGQNFFEQFGEEEWTLTDEYGKAVNPQGHKIGGYAYFTQDDPRSSADPLLLLFQLDSDEMMDLMWGDMGVGHFFIRESDLRAGNFSRVRYDWDCM